VSVTAYGDHYSVSAHTPKRHMSKLVPTESEANDLFKTYCHTLVDDVANA